jgi:NADH dehydrogenase
MAQRIIILGGGFGGVYTAAHLDQIARHDPDVQVTLINRTNYFLMTPLLFEAGSGILEPRHAVNPIRMMFTKARFIQAEIEKIDVDRRIVQAKLAQNESQEIPYDQLVLALGGVTNTRLIKGSEHALTFKNLGDAIYLCNHAIQRFERADVETDPQKKRAQLTFTIIGAGLVGVELVGELTDFVHHLAKMYRHVDDSLIRIELIEALPRIAPEFDESLAEYAQNLLRQRGVNIRTSMKVQSIEPGKLTLEDGTIIESATIVVATGVIPNPLLADVPLQKDKRGKVQVEPTMRVKDRPEIWAIGDCANIPDPSGNPYPPLAQHALREAKVLAKNIAAAMKNQPLTPFVYHTKGTLAALGHYRGMGEIYGFKVKGFVAWWIWRSYYLMQMPRWSRRLRIIVDWTLALFFRNDIVQVDVERAGQQRN